MFHALPRWMFVILIALPLILVLMCGGVIVSERVSANQRIVRITQEMGLDPAQRLASAHHCEFFRCRSYQWFTTAETFAEFEQQVARTAYQPITSGQPRHVGAQLFGFVSINRRTRHHFTQNGSRDGRMETIQWGLKDESDRLIIIYFQPRKDSQDIYMFDDQRIQENMVTVIMDR